jgi:hypothetical protein
VASRKGGADNGRRNLATVPEILPGAARLDDKRPAAGRIYADCTSIYINAGACADTIRVAVSVAAASSCSCWKRCLDSKHLRRLNKLNIVALDQLSSGSMSTRTSTIVPAPVITATRKVGLICARPRLRLQATAPL